MLSTMKKSGFLRKMSHCIDSDNKVSYYLRLKDEDNNAEELALNNLLGQKIQLEFFGKIGCINCGRDIKKSFNQGYCYPCLQSLAECDICIVKPELCHFDKGTCRDNDFAQSHCNINHTIYLSLTSGVKIGITRQHQEQTRWVDQGAVEAIRVATVDRRKSAGLIEAQLSKTMADKTNWRKMLKNEYDEVDLREMRSEVLENIEELIESMFEDEIEDFEPSRTKAQKIEYPVLEYPEKIKSFNFDKDPKVEGTLQGIKGQYLILDTGVINLRKFAGYVVNFEA